jgi:HPt (histidine-containing phosphotransfer) domain-containing protein
MSESGDREAIVSDFAGDPDMVELVEFFVGQMPERVRQLRESFDSGAIDELRTLAHQLKGAGGSYGFPQISESALHLERQSETADLDEIRRGLDDLVDLCNRVQA